jgi:hypothetical protein
VLVLLVLVVSGVGRLFLPTAGSGTSDGGGAVTVRALRRLAAEGAGAVADDMIMARAQTYNSGCCFLLGTRDGSRLHEEEEEGHHRGKKGGG